MKILLFVALLTGLFVARPVRSSAQGKMELSAIGGYLLGSYIRFYEGRINFDDNATYGLSFGAEIAKNNFLEVDYSFTATELEFVPYSNIFNYYKGGVNITYIHIGSAQEFATGGRVHPFGGLSIGSVIFNPDERSISTIWRFDVAFKAGLKIFLTDNVALKLQGRILMPMYFAGVGFYAGIGTGGASSGLSMNAGAVMLQGDFMGGLVLRFGK